MIVNGENISFDEQISGCNANEFSLSDLILHFQLKEKGVAVELNGKILERKGWKSLLLKDTDRIELIRFVGGG